MKSPHCFTKIFSSHWRRPWCRLFTVAASVLALSASQAAPPGQAVQFEQLSSPDQVPDGLSKSDWQSIRAAYEAGRHEFKPVAGKDGQWQARNPGQQWLTTVDQQGFTARPQDAAWAWGLQLQSYGFGEAQTVISGTPVAQAAGQRLTCQWDATMQEWLVNDQRGLEHGFTLAQRPAAGAAGASALSLTLSTRGDLTPVVGAQGVTFQDASGAALVSYTGLKVWDADHTVLASHFEPAGERSFRLVVEERAARYPITIDPIAQQAYLKASNTGGGVGFNPGDNFGYSVAISGDTVVVGAPDEDSSATGVDGDQSLNNASASGAAYLFTLPTAATAPLVTAPTSASITATTATLGGNVTGDGGATITERGIVYALTGTNADPSIGGTGVTQVTTTGTTGIFTLPVTGLSPASGYSYKAYATNSIGTTYTSAATFTTLTMVNHAPVAQDQTLTTPVDTALAITLTATDADNDTLTYALATPPPSIEGTVTGTGANVTFTPAAGFAGLAAFSFTANDGTDQSNEATIFVNVVAAPGSLDVLNTGTDAVPGAPVGSQYFNIRPTAKLNESGHVAFRAWLHVGSGGVTSANDTGIWYQDASGTLQLAGLEGSSAPGTASDVFATFSENPAWTDDGSIAFPAGLLVNHSGIWKDGTLIAQGNAPLPGGSGEVFGNLAFPVLMNNAGQMAFKAQLKAGVGGATTATDELILTRNTSGVINIAAREGSVAPGTTGGLFLKLTSMPDWISQDESGRTVFAGQVATRTTAPVINTVNNRGLWISDGTTTSLAVRGGDPAAGLTATELYYQPSYPVISAGQIAFYSLLRGPTVTAGINDAAIFAGTPGVDLTIIARLGVGSGAGAPAGASTTEFAKLGYPRLGAGAAPTLAFRGELKVGVAAVTLEDNEGIWKKTNGGSPELVVRESDAAPGLPGVQFGTLGQPFVGENGLVLFTSLLKGTGVSGVNDASLWVQLADGTLKQLLRQGQTLSMGLTGETVSDLHATLSGFTGLYSEAPRVMNENDQVVVTVPFTDGTWGVVVLDL